MLGVGIVSPSCQKIHYIKIKNQYYNIPFLSKMTRRTGIR